MNDPIVDEVRSIRAAHAARFNYDLWAIFRDLKEQQVRSGLEFVSFADGPNPVPQPTDATVSVSPGSKSLEATPAAEL